MIPGLGRFPGEGKGYPLEYSGLESCMDCIVHGGFPCGSAGKESACSVGDLGSIPGLGRWPGEGNGYPSVHGVAKSWTHLREFPFPFLSQWGHQRVRQD